MKLITFYSNSCDAVLKLVLSAKNILIVHDHRIFYIHFEKNIYISNFLTGKGMERSDNHASFKIHIK